MDLVDCQSFLLLKKKITETDELITKCQFLQTQLEILQKDQAKQQMELKLMENENALLLSAKRKCESELHQKVGVLKAYENSIKQYTAKINEFEKMHDRSMAKIKTLQAERDTAVSENRKVSSHRNRSLKARSKQTQTELLVQMDDNSRIIIPSFSFNCRQRRRRSSQAVSRPIDNEAGELICKTPTVILPPAERASTPKSSCSDEDENSDDDDITEREMPWLTEIIEQPVETQLCDVTHSESELDDCNDKLLLPYNAMDLSISPLPPTPSMNLDGETNERINTSKYVSTQSDHYTNDDGLTKESHLSSELFVLPDDNNDEVEESTLISSHQLSEDPGNVVVTTSSTNLLLEKATGLQRSPVSRCESYNILSTGSSDERLYRPPTLCIPESKNAAMSSTVESSDAVVHNSPLVSSCNNPSDHSINVPVFVSSVPTGLTSPVALRSVSSSFGKSTKDATTYPSFVFDSYRDSTVNTGYMKGKCHHNAKKHIGNLNRQSSLQLQKYFPSIAERTRSQSSRCKYDSLATPKVTKQAERELSKLEITMNSPSKKTIKTHGLQNYEASRKQTGSRIKKDNGKRKRLRKQPRSDSKRKCYNTSNGQHRSNAGNPEYALSDESDDHLSQLIIHRTSNGYRNNKQSDGLENKGKSESLNSSEGRMDKIEVDFDQSDGELDSSNDNRSEGELEEDKDREAFDETKQFDEEKTEVDLDESKADKSQGKHREDFKIGNKSDGKNIEEKHERKLDKGKDNEEEYESQLNKEEKGREVESTKKKLGNDNYVEEMIEDKSIVENKEEKLENKNKRELKEDKNVVENKEEQLGGDKKRRKLEDRSATEVENKEGKLEDKDEEKLAENRSEIDSKEEKLDEEKYRRKLEGPSHEENRSEIEDKLENISARQLVKNSGEIEEDKSGVDNILVHKDGEELVGNRSEIEEKLEDWNGKELNKDKDKVADKGKKVEDKKEEEIGKRKEIKSDGELDSEEDQSSNQILKTTVDASPEIRQNLFLKSKPTTELSVSEASCVDEEVLHTPHNLLKETNLPGWLEWTIKEEEKASNTIQHSFIKEQKRKRAKYRRMKNQAQKTINYLLANLERLLLKTLKFEKVLEMFSDPCNIASTSEFANALAKFIVEALHPSFENVAIKLAERCNKAVSHNAKIFPHYKPLDENFHPVMLTFESRIVAMLMVIEKHNPKLDNVMGCVADTLRCTLFMSLEDNHIDVHKQCSLIRVITAISRVVGKVDFIQRLCLDLISLQRPLKVSQLPLLQAVAGVWPLVLARKEDVKLYGLREVIPEGLEPQIVSHTVEVTTCYLIGKQDPQEFSHLLFKTFVSFCKWQQLSNEGAMHSLSIALVRILTTSPNIILTSYDSTGQGKWISPQLSATTHMCITCLAVIGKYLGWKWISDNLIREQLWPLLQKWSRKAIGEEVPEAVITAITQLIGIVGKQGVLHDPTCQSVRQLQKMLSSLLQRAHDSPEVTLSIQLAVAESLISLCHPNQLSVAKDVLQNWLTGIKTHHAYAAHTIWNDFAPRVWTMKTVTPESTSNEITY